MYHYALLVLLNSSRNVYLLQGSENREPQVGNFGWDRATACSHRPFSFCPLLVEAEASEEQGNNDSV